MDTKILTRPGILMLNTNYGFIGGVERLMVRMAETLHEHQWKVFGLFEKKVHQDAAFENAFDSVLIVDNPELEDYIKQIKDLGIDIVCIHKTTREKWVKTLQDHFPTVVIVHDHDYYCLRRHKYFPIKRINCNLPYSPLYCPLCTGFIEKKDGKLAGIEIKKHAVLMKQISQCDVSFVLSDYMRKNLVMNGWDIDKIRMLVPFQQISEEERQKAFFQDISPVPTVLYIGQLVRGKGVDLFLRALSTVRVPFKGLIVGRGNDEAYINELIATLGLASQVSLLGWAGEVSHIYEEADIVVVPSRWQEPFGLIGLEAFAHRKPVIGFDIGGISQWLKHRVNGLLVLPGSYAKLAIAIETLLKDSGLRKRYGEAGFKLVLEEYNESRFAESFMLPLNNLLATSHTTTSSNFVEILGIKLNRVTMKEALNLIETNILAANKTPVFFSNADCMNKTFKDPEYKKILKEAKVLFPDGSGLKIASIMLKKPFIDNVNGTDMLPLLCELASSRGFRIFLLGAAPGVAETMKNKLVQKYKGLQISGVRDGFFNWETEAGEVIADINQAKTDILLVAFGAPLQEKFITRYCDEIEASIQMGVGGLFDFYSERIARAPFWMRRIGMEWVFRLMQEPKRMWKRYIIGNPLFLFRVLRWKLSKKA